MESRHADALDAWSACVSSSMPSRSFPRRIFAEPREKLLAADVSLRVGKRSAAAAHHSSSRLFISFEASMISQGGLPEVRHCAVYPGPPSQKSSTGKQDSAVAYSESTASAKGSGSSGTCIGRRDWRAMLLSSAL